MLAFMLTCMTPQLSAQLFFDSPLEYNYTGNDSRYGGNSAGVSVDMDGDGDLDIVGVELGTFGTKKVIVALNNGSGVFNSSFIVAGTEGSGKENRDFAVGDLNSDGLPDIVQVGNSNSFKVFLNITLPGGALSMQLSNYAEGLSNQAYQGVSIVDLNNDGNNDLVITKINSNTELAISLGDGTGVNWAPTQNISLSSGDLGYHVVGDFDDDGVSDIIAAEDFTLHFFKGNSSSGIPTGTFQESVTFSASVSVHQIIAADINEDGLLDLVTNNRTGGNYNILINNNDNDGTSYTGSIISAYAPTDDQARGITLHDMDGDGHLDLLASDAGDISRIFLLKGNGNGTFQSADLYAYSESSPDGEGVTVGDYNGDGLIDMASMDRDLWVFINNTRSRLSIDQGGITIETSDTHDFGLVSVGGNSGAVTFTITNDGTLDDMLTSTPKVVVSGADASMFTVDESSTSNTIASAGGTTTFTVTFTPSSGGNKMVTLTIPSNDISAPYVINLTGRSPNNAGGITAENAVICAGGQTTLTQLAGVLDTGEEWVWYSGSCGDTQVGTGASILVSPTATTTYFVRSENSGTPTSTCVSSQVIVEFKTAVSIASEPSSSVVGGVGDTQTMTVTAAGTGPFTYQWAKNGVDLIDDVRVSGSQSNTLAISSLNQSDEDTYICLVANTCSEEITGDINLIVAQLPPNSVCGNLLDFDGSDDYINFGDAINEAVNAITLEALINVDELGGSRQDIINKSAPGGTDPFYQYHLDVRPNGTINFALTLDNTYNFLQSNIPIAVNRWYHIAATYDGSTMRIYVDGVEQASRSTSGSISVFSEDLKIGEGFNNGSANFNGQIDEVRIWDIARSPSEIQAASITELQGNEVGLLGYWNFNEGSGGNNLLDQTGADNHGFLTNMDPLTDWIQEDGSIGGNTSSAELVSLFNASSYDWNGNTYTVTGTYVETFPNAISCDSLAILNLVFEPSPPNTICGNTLDFDGVDDYIDIGNVINSPTNAITLEAWILTNALGTRQDIIDKSAPEGDDPFYQYHMDIRPEGTVNFALALNDTHTFLRTTSTIQPSRWYHIAATYDGSNMRIYINGVEEATRTASGDISVFSEDLKIGEGFNNGTTNFNGQIDEVRIWDLRRTQAEIIAAMDIELLGNETNLSGYWNFNEGRGGDNLLDQTSSDNHGVLTNMDPLADWFQDDGSAGGNTSSVDNVNLINTTSYDWNGATYTTDGTYTATFPNAVGCDSLAILNLVFEPTPPNTGCGNTLDFDGVDDYVHMGDVINSPLNAITLEAWIRTDVLGSQRQDIIDKAAPDNAEPFYQYHLDVRPTGIINFTLALDNTQTFLRTTFKIQPNRWYHIAATYDGSNMRVYIDGVEEAIRTASGDISVFTEPLKIGEGYTGLPSHFNGQIDEVRIWDVARTQSEISAFKDAELQGNELGLQGYWNFDEGKGGASLLDQTSHDHHGILTNMDPLTDWLQGDGSVGGNTSSSEFITLFNETSYDWNGNTYTAEGTYTLTLPNSMSCDSLAILNLVLVSAPPNTVCGNVLEFDGTNDHIDLGDVANNPSNTITLEAWVFTDEIGRRQDIINKSAPGGSDPFYQYHLDIRPNGQINFALTLGGTYNFAQTNTAIVANRWQHIAATYDGSNMRIYIDGIERVTKSASGSITVFSEPLQIGKSHLANVDFDGRVDEVRIWESARTQVEILAAKDVELQGNETGLVGYWNFNDGIESTLLNDQTSNGYDGVLTNMDALTDWVGADGLLGGNTRSEQSITVFNATSYDLNGNTYTTDGTYTTTLLNAAGCDSLLTLNLTFVVGPPNTSCGNTLDFDGVNDHVNMGDLIEPTAEITLETWIKTDAIGVRQDIIDKAFSGAVEPFYQYHLDLRPDGAINFSLGLSNGRVPLQTDPAVISANQWHHVAATYDGTTMRIFIDGIEEISTSASGSIQNFSEPLKIGESFDGPAGSRPFNGQIDEVRIWDIARTQTEIANNKDIQLLGNETNLAGYWSFDQGSGSEYLTDQTINEYHGVLTDMSPLTDWMQLDGSINGNTGSTLVIDQQGPYTSPSGNNTWSESGIYADIIPNIVGCDSTITVDLTLAKMDQTITFESLENKTYGDTDFTLSATADSGLPVTFSSTDPSVATVSGNTVTIVGIGTTTITASQAGSSNYNPAINIDQTLTILTKPIIITADAGQTKIYGQSDPVFTYTTTTGSLESGDEFTGFLNRSVGEDVDSYAIGQGTLSAGPNYTITFISNDFSIAPKPITVTADLSQTKVYGQLDPIFSYSATAGALEGGDAFSGLLDRVIGESAGIYPMGIGTLSAGTNYTITFVSNDLLITSKPITVTADPSQTKIYGQADPVFTYSPEAGALEAGDAFIGALDRVIGESIGNYSISLGTLSAGTNYAITFVSNDFSITSKPITVTADPGQTKIYGQADPIFTYSPEAGALEAGDTFTGALNRVAGENAGNYAIGMGTLDAGSNYTITFVSNDFSITPKSITLTADSELSKVYGQSDPLFTYSLTAGSLESGDALSGSPDRVAGENAGNYPIGQGTVSAGSDYTLNFVSNDFLITKKLLTATADDKSKSYGDTNPVFTLSYAGFEFGEEESVIDTPPTASTIADEMSNVDDYPISLSGGLDNNYDFTFVEGTLTIGKTSLMVAAGMSSQIYGGPGIPNGISYTGFLNGDDESDLDVPVVVTSSVTPTTPVSAGSENSVTLAGGSDDNYNIIITEPNGTFEVTKASLTAVLDNQTRAYGAANPPFTFTLSGFVNGEDETVIDELPVFATNAVNSSVVGDYFIFAIAFGSDDNYILPVPGAALTITPATLTAIADDQSRAYGEDNPTLSMSYTGFVNGEDESVLTSVPATTTTATALSNVGDYPITVNGGSADNYTLDYQSGTLSVSKAILNATADNKSRTYGDANPALTFSYSGFVNGEDETILDNVSTAVTSATTADNAGDYPITISAGLDNNYDVVGINGTLTINRKSIVGQIGTLTRNYGDPISFDGITFNFTESDFVNGDTEAVLTGHYPDLFLNGVTSSSPVGNHAILTVGGTGNTALNYTVFVFSSILNYQIVPAPLSITADNKVKLINDPNPALTVSYDGFVNGEDESILTTAPVISTTAITSSPVGDYPIIFDNTAAADNYVITQIDGTLTVSASEPLTITVDAQSKIYGDSDPSFTYQLTSGALMAGDMITGELSRMSGDDVGTYAIEMGTLTAGSGYVITLVSNDLTITPKALAITTDANQSKVYGEADPIYTYTQTGTLESGDVLTGALARTSGEDVGSYAINQGTLTAGSNYAIAFTGSNFGITAKPLTITADASQEKMYGQSDPMFTYSETGLVGGDLLVGSLARVAGEDVGNYAINQGSLTAGGNYSITFNDADFIITEKTITVTADAGQTKVYGQADPVFDYTPSSGALEAGDAFMGSLERTVGESVGNYSINQGTLNAGINYVITFIPNDFTITPKALAITADANQSKVYGAADPIYTFTQTGTLESGDVLTGALARSAGADVGTYAINQGTLTAGSNYDITFTWSNFGITAKPMMITVNAGQEKVYGQSDPVFTYSQTGTLEGGDLLIGSLARVAGEDVGSYAINQGSLTAGSNYAVTFAGSNFGITAKPLTITTDAGQTKVYGQSDPAFTYTQIGTLEVDDLLIGSLARVAGEDAGNYTINQGNLTAGSNYSITFNEADFIITEKAITVTADAGQSKVYGDSDPVFTHTITVGALESGDALTGVLDRVAGEDVGNYAIEEGTLSAGINYNLTYISNDFAIGARAITITADAKTKTYGDSDPALTYQITSGSLVSPDAFTGSLTRVTGEDAGDYSIQQGNVALNSNYELTYVDNNLTIGTRSIEVTAENKTKTVGQSDPALTYAITNGTLAFTNMLTGTLTRVSGESLGSYAINQGSVSAGTNYNLAFVPGDLTITNLIAQDITFTALPSVIFGDATFDLSAIGGASGNPVTFTSTNPAVATISGTTVTIVGAGTTNIEADQAGDATHAAASTVIQPLVVHARSVEITADAKTKTYGDSADPVLTYQITSGSLAAPDMFTGTLTRVAGENAGTYAIQQGGVVLNGNYDLTYISDDLTIGTRAIEITADAKAKTYGGSDPALTYQITSGALVAPDVFTGNLTRIAGENAGTYTIQQGGVVLNGNYALTYVSADLTVETRSIEISADTKAKTYGDADPGLTYQITSGALVAPDVFAGTLTRAIGENAGTYLIQQGGVTLSSNYDLTYISADLTIGTRAIEITADAKSKTYSDTDPVLTHQITSGSLVFSDTFSGTLERVPGENVGTYAINQGTVALNSDYVLSYISSDLIIDQATQTITFNPLANAVQGDIDLTLPEFASSGLSITYMSSDPLVATVSGNTLSFLGAGTTTITATQTGDSNYAAATPVMQDLTVASLYIWDGTVWNTGAAPTSSNNARIDGDYTFSVNGSFDANNLILSTGTTLTLDGTNTMAVNGSLTNDGTLHVTSEASLLTLGTVSGTGYQIDRETTFDTNTGRYSIVGSPIQSADFSMLGANALIYGYDESAAFNPTGNTGLDRFKTPAQLSQTTMNVGAGYFSGFTGDVNGLVSFTGTPNTGTINVPLSYTDQGAAEETAYQGFNLVSNPYPSGIDYTSLMSENNAADIDGSIYLWDDNSSDTGRGDDMDYLIVNSMGNTDSRSNGLTKWDGSIRSGQGFFVKANSSTSMQFTNTMRGGSNTDAGFFRKSNTLSSFKLLLSNGEVQRATVIGFAEDATVGKDKNYDASSLSGGALQLYTLQADDLTKLGIQGVPNEYQDDIRLGFHAEAGSYTISLADFDLSTAQDVILLKDHARGIVIDLTEEDYSFSTGSGENKDRFTIQLSNTITANIKKQFLKNIFTHTTEDQLHVVFKSGNFKEAHIRLIDLTGQTLVDEKVRITNSRWETALSDLPKNLYILMIETEMGVWKGKVIIK